VAGGRTFPFDNGAVELLFEFSRGNIRAISEIARKSMEIADMQNCDVIDKNHVVTARSKLPY